jgi:hypothetical protein
MSAVGRAKKAFAADREEARIAAVLHDAERAYAAFAGALSPPGRVAKPQDRPSPPA